MTLLTLIITAILIYYFFIYRDNIKPSLTLSRTKKCPNCNNPVEDRFNVCPICKETLKRKCAQCNESIDSTWSFCPYCEIRQTKSDNK